MQVLAAAEAGWCAASLPGDLRQTRLSSTGKQGLQRLQSLPSLTHWVRHSTHQQQLMLHLLQRPSQAKGPVAIAVCCSLFLRPFKLGTPAKIPYDTVRQR